MKVAFDTNVLLHGEHTCRRIIDKMIDTDPPVIKLALDLTGHLEREYQEAADEDPESDLARVYYQFLNERDVYVDNVDGSLPSDGHTFFTNDLSCPHEVEPALFGIGYSNPNDVYVYSQSAWRGGHKSRCYPSQYAALERKYLPNNYRLHEILFRVLADSGCPSDYAALCTLIEADKAKVQRGEDSRCEYKVMLDQNVVDKIPRTACAMLNAEGGYILIGVSDDRQIKGFQGSTRKGGDVDAINNKIIDSITPKPAGLFFINEVKNIPMEIVGKVIAIYVQKGATKYCCTAGKYRGVYKRANARDEKTGECMIIINFSHPLDAAQISQAESLIGSSCVRVINVPTHFGQPLSFIEQAQELVASIGLSNQDWQTKPLLVNLPSFSPIAALVLAELHGRMGYFPAVLRLRSVPDTTPPQFEVAEIINLQAVRDAARQAR